MERQWWERLARVIQTNLQVKGMLGMSAGRLAEDVVELGGNVLAVNVGGVYAWYDSQVPYRHINEWPPEGRDLLRETAEGCHQRAVRVIARFGFSKADDSVFLQKPQWFVRNPDETPHAYGVERPGPWNILYNTCINGGYRNHGVTAPVLRETLGRYAFDGVFLNAPNYEPCFCESCREKYRRTFGEELPIEWEGEASAGASPILAHRRGIAGVRPEWESLCCRDNIQLMRETVQKAAPRVPVILHLKTYGEDLDARATTADILCAEVRGVLSQGKRDFTPFWLLALNAKYGSTPEQVPAPSGIIHSYPGMDWRHTGLPGAEYRSWMSRVAANGANPWHSVTGFKETIGDKRLFHTIRAVNQNARQAEEAMEGAKGTAQVLLVWNGTKSVEGWLEGLLNTQIQFDMEDELRFDAERAGRYEAVIVPAGGRLLEKERAELERCVKRGIRLVIEECRADQTREAHGFLGIEEEVQGGGELAAAYWKFGRETSRGNLEETVFLPHHGETLYRAASPSEDMAVEATLVPPFAPLDGVGAPPERASLPAEHMELPLCVTHKVGDGAVLYLPFAFGQLIGECGLPDGLYLLENMIDRALMGWREFCMEPYPGLEAVLYRTERGTVLHLIDPVGQRSLMRTVSLKQVEFTLRLPKEAAGGKEKVKVSVLSSPGGTVLRQDGDVVTVMVEKVEVWSAVEVTWKDTEV